MEKVQHKFYYQNKAARSIMLLVFICEVHSPSQKIVLQPQWVSSNKAVRRSQENPYFCAIFTAHWNKHNSSSVLLCRKIE